MAYECVTIEEFREEFAAAVPAAEREVFAAQRLRVSLRRKTKPGGVRQAAIEDQLERLRFPEIRRLLGVLAWLDVAPTKERRLRAASRGLQAERRALRKMLR